MDDANLSPRLCRWKLTGVAQFKSSRVTVVVVVYGFVRGLFFPLMRGQKHPALTAPYGPDHTLVTTKVGLPRDISLTNPY